MASLSMQRAVGVQPRAAARLAPRAIPALKGLPLRPAAKQVRRSGDPLTAAWRRFVPPPIG